MERKQVKEVIQMVLGVVVLAGGVKIFDEPNHLVAGGLTGLGILLNFLGKAWWGRGIPLWLTSVLFNIPLFFCSRKIVGKAFFWRSLLGSALFSVALFGIDFLPKYQGDMILVALFGGTLVGTGAGLVLGAMSSTGGTDLAAMILHQKFPRFSVGKLLFFIDAVIIALGLAVFGMESAMYAILSIYVASKFVNFIVEGGSFSRGAFIISDFSKEIAGELMKELGRGVTALTGTGMYTKTEKEVLLCVFSQKEIGQVKGIIRNIDTNAFFILADVREVLGEGFGKVGN